MRQWINDNLAIYESNKEFHKEFKDMLYPMIEFANSANPSAKCPWSDVPNLTGKHYKTPEVLVYLAIKNLVNQ